MTLLYHVCLLGLSITETSQINRVKSSGESIWIRIGAIVFEPLWASFLAIYIKRGTYVGYILVAIFGTDMLLTICTGNHICAPHMIQ